MASSLATRPRLYREWRQLLCVSRSQLTSLSCLCAQVALSTWNSPWKYRLPWRAVVSGRYLSLEVACSIPALLVPLCACVVFCCLYKQEPCPRSSRSSVASRAAAPRRRAETPPQSGAAAPRRRGGGVTPMPRRRWRHGDGNGSWPFFSFPLLFLSSHPSLPFAHARASGGGATSLAPPPWAAHGGGSGSPRRRQPAAAAAAAEADADAAAASLHQFLRV